MATRKRWPRGQAAQGLQAIWAAYADGSLRSNVAIAVFKCIEALFLASASDAGISEMEHRQALKILEQQDAVLPKATVHVVVSAILAMGPFFG